MHLYNHEFCIKKLINPYQANCKPHWHFAMTINWRNTWASSTVTLGGQNFANDTYKWRCIPCIIALLVQANNKQIDQASVCNWPIQMNVISHWRPVHFPRKGPGVRVTKSPFVNCSASNMFDLGKGTVILVESHSCWTGVTAPKLRPHLSNINVLFNS